MEKKIQNMERMEGEANLGLLEKQQNLDLEILAIMNSRMKTKCQTIFKLGTGYYPVFAISMTKISALNEKEWYMSIV